MTDRQQTGSSGLGITRKWRISLVAHALPGTVLRAFDSFAIHNSIFIFHRFVSKGCITVQLVVFRGARNRSIWYGDAMRNVGDLPHQV